MIRLSERWTNRVRRSRHTGGRYRTVLPISALLATTLLCAPASIAATPADTAATHALLQARYELYKTLLHDTRAARSSTAKLADSLGRECRGVLAGELKEEGLVPPEGSPTPRARGERERSERQRRTIVEELGTALGAADESLNRGAVESYVAATAPLSWSDARIAPLVRARATRLQESVTVAPPDVCADMKAWAQSGYRLLSPGSRAFQTTQTARTERIEPEGSLRALLKPFEGAAELALVRRTTALREKLTGTLSQTFNAYVRLQSALGVPESPFEEHRRAPILGRRKTRSGEIFTVRRETSKESLGSSCRNPVSVELTEESSKGGAIVEGGSSSGPVCLSARGDRQTSGGCDRGVTSLTAAVPANVRTVRLRLSDGSTIASAVVRVPRKDGGPAGVYAQAIRGYKRYPVSLTELDLHGNVVRVVPVRVTRCKKERHSAEPDRPTFFNLADGTFPGGQAFTIQGTLVTFGAHHDFSLSAMVGIENSNGEASGEGAVGRTVKPKAFPWSQAMGCPPRSFTLIFGILAAPGDSVLALTPEGLVPLTKLEIAANLDSRGPLVYGAFSSLPSELIVRRSDGTTLYAESLAAKATEDAQFCEGLVEG